MLKRHWALVAFAYLALAEALSLAPVPDLSLCLVQPEHSQQASDHDDKKYCPAFHVAAALALEKADTFLEHHDKSVVGGFTIVLAISTIGLWFATNKLWAAGEKQFGLLAETAAAQSRDMQTSIAAAQRSADIAGRNLVVANRPWISADVRIASDLTFGAPAAAQMTFEYVLKNTGNTPGINVQVYPKLILLEFGVVEGDPPTVVIQSFATNPPAVLADLCKMASAFGDIQFPDSPIVGDAIFPGDKLIDRVTLQLGSEEIERARQTSFHKVINLMLLVCINYKSPVEGASHQTGYIFNVFTNDPRHPNGVDPKNGDIPMQSLGLTRTFRNSFAT